MKNVMLFARIDAELVRRVMMSALEEYTAGVLANPSALKGEKVEAAYLLARMRRAMNQRLPFAYIREPSQECLANAAKAAREEVCHAG